MSRLFKYHDITEDAEALNPDRLQRVATVKARNGGRRHLMCGRDELNALCKCGLGRHSLKDCQLSPPVEVNCFHCLRVACFIAEQAANEQAFDLLEKGTIEIFSDMLLESGKPRDLFVRRLVLIYPTFRELFDIAKLEKAHKAARMAAALTAWRRP